MQAILLHALAVHAVAAVGGGVPNPAPQAPPGLAREQHDPRLGQVGVLICGVAGLLISGGKMAIGHRNRSTLAADGATGIPWVIGGLSLVAASAAIVAVFL